MRDEHPTAPADGVDFLPLERRSAGDFPFYRGSPVAVSGPGWALVMLGVLLGFAALIAPFGFYRSTAGGFVAVTLFFAIPLAFLAFVAGRSWTAIFRKITLRDCLWMVAVAVANILVSVAVVLLIRKFFDMNANPVGGILGDASSTDRVLFFLKTIPQLFGEEVVSVLPFLALLWLVHTKLGWTRKASIAAAWIGAAIFFGAIHLPTYDWNFVQCFLVIGMARVVLLAGYVITKNIWVSTGAHIINDWVIFGVMVIGAGA